MKSRTKKLIARSLFWVAIQYGRKIGGKRLAEIPSDAEVMLKP